MEESLKDCSAESTFFQPQPPWLHTQLRKPFENDEFQCPANHAGLTAKPQALTLAEDNLTGPGKPSERVNRARRVKIEIGIRQFQFLGKAVKIGHGPATVIGSRWVARIFSQRAL